MTNNENTINNLKASGAIPLGETPKERAARMRQEKIKALKSSGQTINNTYHGDYNSTKAAGDNFGNIASGRDAKQEMSDNNIVTRSSGSSININSTKPSAEAQVALNPVEPASNSPELKPSADRAQPTPENPENEEHKQQAGADENIKEEKTDSNENAKESDPEPEDNNDEPEPPRHERPDDRYENMLPVPDINPAIQQIAEKYVKARRLDNIGDVRLEELEQDSDFHQAMEQYRYIIGHNYMYEHPNATVAEVEAFLTCEQIKQENDIKNTVIDRWDNGSLIRRAINWKNKHPVLATVALGGAVAVAGIATGGFGLAGVAGASLGGAIGVGAAKGGIFGFLGSRQNSSKASIRGAWGDDNNPEGHTADERRHGQYMALAEALVRGANQEELMSLITGTVNRDAYIIRESAYRDRTKNRAKTVGGVATGAIVGGAIGGITHGLTNWQHEAAGGPAQTEPVYNTQYETVNNSSPVNIDDMRVDYYQNSPGYTGVNTEETLINNIRNLGLNGVSEDHVRGLFHDAVSRLPGDVYSGGNIANSVGTLSSPGNEAARWVIDDVMQHLSGEGAFGTSEVPRQVLTQAAEQITNNSMENVLNENARNVANVAADTLTAAAAFVVGNRIARGGAADHPTAVGGPIENGQRSAGGQPTGGNQPAAPAGLELPPSPESPDLPEPVYELSLTGGAEPRLPSSPTPELPPTREGLALPPAESEINQILASMFHADRDAFVTISDPMSYPSGNSPTIAINPGTENEEIGLSPDGRRLFSRYLAAPAFRVNGVEGFIDYLRENQNTEE